MAVALIGILVYLLDNQQSIHAYLMQQVKTKGGDAHSAVKGQTGAAPNRATSHYCVTSNHWPRLIGFNSIVYLFCLIEF